MNESSTCEVFYVDKEKVAAVQKKMAEIDYIHPLAEIFQLLSDPTRLRILLALREGELCVCDLATLLGVTRSAVSHQLRLLRNLRLVKFRKEGKIAYYSLDDPHVNEIIQVTVDHLHD